jgi:hypothetical protein
LGGGGGAVPFLGNWESGMKSPDGSRGFPLSMDCHKKSHAFS